MQFLRASQGFEHAHGGRGVVAISIQFGDQLLLPGKVMLTQHGMSSGLVQVL